MKEIYTARNSIEAHLIAEMLQRNSIEVRVRGESLFGFPIGQRYPSVCVKDDAESARARDLVKSFLQELKEAEEVDWTCAECGETLEMQFLECWQCGTSRFPGRTPDAN